MDATNANDRFKALVRSSEVDRAHVRYFVDSGRPYLAEDDPNRARAYDTRRQIRAGRGGAESIQGNTTDYQTASFLSEGALVRRAVAYVEVNDTRKSEVGSGFLVSPRLFLTNFHVISDVAAGHSALITFDRENDERGRPRATTSFLLDPDAFALFSPEEELDYALIAVGARSVGTGALGDFGYCPLSNTPDRHKVGMNVNIIHHPGGWPKMITIRNNLLTYRTDRTLLYETDTINGSSGSPVFNDDWDLVALHHYGSPFLEQFDENHQPIPINVNEGVRCSAIYEDLTRKASTLGNPGQRELLAEALSFATASASQGGGKVLSPPRPIRGGESIEPVPRRGTTMDSPSDSSQLRVTIPLEITIRLAPPSAGSAPVTSDFRVPPDRTLSRKPESIQIDEDYSNRKGYNPRHIPGTEIPLPETTATLGKQIAPLRAGEDHPELGRLLYEHFTVVLNKRRRIAIFTATNIDGATYLDVDRKTGEVSDSGAEGDKWFLDTRVSDAYFLGQSFYSDWSDYFDRGHLTRRVDPTWGTPAEAERANADTFHFTNCSPQHWRFNQRTKFWQGAERYVLENGLLVADQRKPVTVFQGPIFDDTIDQMADDVQIPSSFFKVIVWKGKNGLKAVGLVVDQLPLLSEKRKGSAPPKDLPSVDVQHWRLSIAQIGKRTGLTFAPAILAADTIAQPGQPDVGGEAARLVRGWEDLLA